MRMLKGREKGQWHRGQSWKRSLAAFIILPRVSAHWRQQMPKGKVPLRWAKQKFLYNPEKAWPGESKGKPQVMLYMWDPQLGCHGPDCCTLQSQCGLKQGATLPINRFLLRTERIKPQQLQKSPKRKRGIPRNLWCSYIYFFFSYKSSTIPTPLKILTVMTAPRQRHGKKREKD